MQGGYKIDNQSGIYYLTFQIVRWIDIFSRQVYKDIVIESLKFCQKNKGLNVHYYVIMSNHVHAIMSSNNDDLNSVIRDFKTFTSKEIIRTINSINESRNEWMLNLFEFEVKKHKRNDSYQVCGHMKIIR